jgi:tetratricopeptide (TPR) repeat protein
MASEIPNNKNPHPQFAVLLMCLMALLMLSKIASGQSVKKTVSRVESNMAEGKYYENIALLDAAILKKPDEPELFKLQILNYLSLGKKNKGDSIFSAHARLFLDADFIDFYIQRAYETGQYRNIVNACRNKKLQNKIEISGWDKYFQSLIKSGNSDSLEYFAEKYIAENSKQYLGYFYKGYSLELKKVMERAKTEYNKSLYYTDQIPEVKNYALACIHSGLARISFYYNQYEDALTNCGKALNADNKLSDIHYLKAKILIQKKQFSDAQEALYQALTIDSENLKLLEAIFYNSIKINNPGMALNYIKKLGSLTSLNDTLLFDRAKIYLQNKIYLLAYLDLKNLKKKGRLFPGMEDVIREAKIDKDQPWIRIMSPVGDTIEYGIKEKKISFEIMVDEKSGLTSFAFNDSMINLNMDTSYVFYHTVAINKYKTITFSATDVYDNSTKVSIPIKVDLVRPLIDVAYPQLVNGRSLVPENPDDPYMYLEMNLSDNNKIEKVLVNGVERKIAQKNQTKCYDKISIDKKDSIVIEVDDEMGNRLRKSYFIDRERARENSRNPMGKTFVLILTNFKYQNLKELNGPASDAQLLKSCLLNYSVDSIIHYENLTLADFRKAINTDVSSWVNKFHVKSLLIWYGGHGTYSEFHNSGYWIPVDAVVDDFENYYSLTELKIALSANKKLNHLLLISDACQTGQSFYAKSILKSTSSPCSEWQLTKMRSAECFTSSDSQLSSDNSIFAKTFTKVLQNDPSECLGIVSVAEKVTEIVLQNQAQTPIFGNITGMESENGSFVFIKRSFVEKK